ncbi:phospholipase PldA [Rhizodiscina lignyota]|uniref:Phospholipase n=1 Tax=Rhizodiscina lignyota TaxID=1504668 RepID=A0A9P4IGK6_9PEZI|nr:phospholipase PldA [Rhizodiscina lignyota]
MTDGSSESKHPHLEAAKEDVKHPFASLRQKLKNTHLVDVEKKFVNTKNKLGKLSNLVNRNHRHDEEHEKRTDAKRSKIAESHRFESFAPERDGNLIKWYVDGRDYFHAVSVALERAKEVIYIADWWLSPELFLRRPPYFNQEWRLDQVLKRRAAAGVKIYIIVYKEVEAAITCNSRHTKRALMNMFSDDDEGAGNITVMRHPDHNVFENMGDMTFYWAHHEKFIVIDHQMAFVGGLDLCFGRWDQKQHPLSDVHPGGVIHEIFPGQDFNNNRVMDFHSVADWKQNQLSKAEYGRMPWHDISVGLIGPCVYDIAEHFVLRWNFCKRDKYKRDKRYDWLTLEGREGEDEDLVAVQRPKFPVGDYIHHPLNPLSTKNLDNRGTVHAQVVRSSADWSSGILTEHSIMNAYCELIRNAQHYVYIENQFFVTATGEEQAPIHNVIGRAIVDACVRASKEGRKFRVIIMIPAIPGFAGDLREDAAIGTRAIMDYQYKSICRGDHSIYGQIKAQGVDPKEHIFVFNLRSFDRLNYTKDMKAQEEKSGVTYQQVQQAHAEEIMSSGLHGKGVESDSSSSSSDDDSRDVARQQAVDMKRRFEERRESAAVEEQENLKSDDSIAKDAMLHNTEVTDEKWAEDDEAGEAANFIQEELYIHAKLCIIDDTHVIIGSSNINDRSQIGTHDSELSLVMTDTDTIDSTMDGQPFKAAKFAATLRRTLWREHLGLYPPEDLDPGNEVNAHPPGDGENDAYEGKEYEFVADPMSNELWEMWTSSATTNTQIFRNVFHADPDDNIRTFEDYAKFTPNPKTDKEHRQGHVYDKSLSATEIRKELAKIKGHIVWMPLDFLCDAEMAEKGLQVNQFTESVYA